MRTAVLLALLCCCLAFAARAEDHVTAGTSAAALLPGGDAAGANSLRMRSRSLLASPIADFDAAVAATAGGSATNNRKLAGTNMVIWDIDACDVSTQDTVRCNRGYAAACCNTYRCSSNADGSHGWCSNDSLLGCCGKK